MCITVSDGNVSSVTLENVCQSSQPGEKSLMPFSWNEMKWRIIIACHECNICNCREKPEKKFRTSTGFDPMTFFPNKRQTWPTKPYYVYQCMSFTNKLYYVELTYMYLLSVNINWWLVQGNLSCQWSLSAPGPVAHELSWVIQQP